MHWTCQLKFNDDNYLLKKRRRRTRTFLCEMVSEGKGIENVENSHFIPSKRNVLPMNKKKKSRSTSMYGPFVRHRLQLYRSSLLCIQRCVQSSVPIHNGHWAVPANAISRTLSHTHLMEFLTRFSSAARSIHIGRNLYRELFRVGRGSHMELDRIEGQQQHAVQLFGRCLKV